MISTQINKQINKYALYYQNIVSVYFYEKNVFVVELKKTLKEIHIIKSNQYEISEDVLEEINSEFNLKDKKTIVNFYPPSGSFKLLEIPKMPVAEIDSWLSENSSEFLPTGLSINDIFLAYKIIKSNDEIILLIAILNKDEFEHFTSEIIKTEGILSLVYPGSLNFITELKPEDEHTENEFFYIENKDYHELVIKDNETLLYYNQIPKAFQSQNKVDAIQKLFMQDLQLLDIDIGQENINVIQPQKTGFEDVSINLDKKYLAAYRSGLSYFDNADTFNILSPELQLDSEIVTWKQIFLRSSLVAGIAVFGVYLVAFLLVLFMGFLNSGLEEERALLAPQLSELARLQSQKQILETDLAAAIQVKKFKSNSSVLLDMFSYHIPKECWLTKIDFNVESDKSFNTMVRGMSKDESNINTFLRNLESDKNIKSVKLDYINNLSSDEMYRDWKIRSSRYIEFQISMVY